MVPTIRKFLLNTVKWQNGMYLNIITTGIFFKLLFVEKGFGAVEKAEVIQNIIILMYLCSITNLPTIN